MKKLLTICLLFFAALVHAQEPAMLSIKGIGGNGYDRVYPLINKTNDGGGITFISTTSDQGTGNINTQCNFSTTDYSGLFRKYDGNGVLEWEKCYTNNPDS